MRQLVGLMRVINKAKLIDFYQDVSSYALIHKAKLPSLDEFLGISLAEETKVAFDPNVDKFLEQKALEKLRERQQSSGTRK